MKKLTAASIMTLALAISASSATAADYEAQVQQLVVSGVVESWNGYTFISDEGGANANFDPDGYLSSGLSGRFSLPLGENLSIQMDGDLEYTENAFDDPSGDGFKYSAQFGSHLTYRDPSAGAFGVFGAFGASHYSRPHVDFHAVGGEAQLYLGDLTFYVQGGVLDTGDAGSFDEDAFNNAMFGRGVVRWFMTPDSRLQGEISYADGDQDTGGGAPFEMSIIEWKVRYDTVLMGLPLIGDTPVFVGYCGARFDNEGAGPNIDDGQFTEHTIMVGTSYSFGGNSMREFDRVGATLDLPSFGRWIASGSMLDTF